MKKVTEQEIFDRVATHLLAQQRASVSRDNHRCRYRNDFGLKCAIGALIPDDLYRPQMENLSVVRLLQNFPELSHYMPDNTLPLCKELQSIHDRTSSDKWLIKLYKVAKQFKLATYILDRRKQQEYDTCLLRGVTDADLAD